MFFTSVHSSNIIYISNIFTVFSISHKCRCISASIEIVNNARKIDYFVLELYIHFIFEPIEIIVKSTSSFIFPLFLYIIFDITVHL